MTSDPAIRLLRELVAINSINPSLVSGAPGEAEMARAVADEMRDAGLDVEMQEVAPGRPNAVGILEGRRAGRTLMLCGHLDTVGVDEMPQPFEPIERDGRLYGRGSQDMKGGLAAIVSAARAIVEHGGLAAGRLVVAGVVDEEHSSLGADELVRSWSADGAVIAESTELTIAVAHKGFCWLDVEVFGARAHGSRPHEGVDAILRMGRVLRRLEALDRDLQARPPHRLLGTASLHASLIKGGRELSSYPERAMLTMERRTLPGEADALPLDEVQAILEALRREDPSFSAAARVLFGRAAYELPDDNEVARTLADALRRTAMPVKIAGATYWADSAILGAAGIPSVLFGPGGAGLHSSEEYVRIADVLMCRDALAEFARSFCGSGQA
jgi:acetylornithine deacetylase